MIREDEAYVYGNTLVNGYEKNFESRITEQLRNGWKVAHLVVNSQSNYWCAILEKEIS